MRPPSKHGLERKFKSWRKGKASSSKAAAGGDRSVKRPTNVSLKNRLRGQKRFLAKLQRDNNSEDGDEGNQAAIEGVKKQIAQLGSDIAAYEAQEREKKNSAKYHQVKFIERQKLTRLEKSITRQLQQLEQSSSDSNKDQIAKLQHQLQSVAMDQLYIAFYPANMKYMGLFTNGMERVVDDERVQKRRKDVWTKIREGLLEDLKSNDKDHGSDSSSVPSSSDESDGENEEKEETETKSNGTMKIQLNSKSWINLDAAKRALLSMPLDAYPNSYSSIAETPSEPTAHTRNSKFDRGSNEKAPGATANKKEKKVTKPTSDSRFTLSKRVDGLFHESTTGEDYHKELSADDSDSESSDSSSEDDADPLKGFEDKKQPVDNKTAGVKPSGKRVAKDAKDVSSSSSSSSSSSEDSSDSDSSDSASDNEEEDSTGNSKEHIQTGKEVTGNDNDDEEEDDFFTTTNDKVSTEDIFAQAQKNQKSNRHSYNNGSNDRQPDKSRGFKSQNQKKSEYQAYQHREKRQKFG